ncbi:MAG: hypothetical protein ABEI75_04200 [Halobaculum sp.]
MRTTPFCSGSDREIARDGAKIGSRIGAAAGSRVGPFATGIASGFGGAAGYLAGAALDDVEDRFEAVPDGGREVDPADEGVSIPVSSPE